MFLHTLEIKQFRCFSSKQFIFSKQITLITGDNGSGKTSLAEAIHFLCYMKSFRSSNIADLVNHASSSFFLRAHFRATQPQISPLDHTIQVGYSDKKKAIKLDNKVVTTYKEIFEKFQAVTLLEEDIYLIKGGPTGRRTFIDGAIMLLYPASLDTYKSLKRIVQHRNALLHSYVIDTLELNIWTEKLWLASQVVQKQRKELLATIEQTVNALLKQYFDNAHEVRIDYELAYTKPNESFIDFKRRIEACFAQEKSLKRSIFGAHLDDFSITIKGKNARFFASRGQQKLVSLLCKLSLIELANLQDFLPIVLVDDFIADFDHIRLQNLIKFFVSCKNQIIITTPYYDQDLQKILGSCDPEVIYMDKL